MAATQYQIFCRYFHPLSNHIVTNSTPVKWVSGKTQIGGAGNAQGRVTTATSSKPGYENCWIRQEDGLFQDNQGQKLKAAKVVDTTMRTLLSVESQFSNPKFDMLFVYDGFTSRIGPNKDNPPPSDSSTAPILYYENMKRIDTDNIWFLYATCASLNAVMKKADELIQIEGMENVIIGKVVALDEFIDIE